MGDQALQIGFLLFDNLTQLDLTGPWEVLSRLRNAECHLVAKNPAPVLGSGLGIVPTTTYSDCPDLDLLCVPGGPGHLAAMEDVALLDFLRSRAPRCRYVTAICTGSLVLAAAGLLTGYRATSHWMSRDRLALFGAIPENARVVIDRDRVTGGGVTAGIDFALTLVALLADEERAQSIQLQIEYAPDPPFAGRPEDASPALVDRLKASATAYTARMAEVDKRAADQMLAYDRRHI